MSIIQSYRSSLNDEFKPAELSELKKDMFYSLSQEAGSCFGIDHLVDSALEGVLDVVFPTLVKEDYILEISDPDDNLECELLGVEERSIKEQLLEALAQRSLHCLSNDAIMQAFCTSQLAYEPIDIDMSGKSYLDAMNLLLTTTIEQCCIRGINSASIAILIRDAYNKKNGAR